MRDANGDTPFHRLGRSEELLRREEWINAPDTQHRIARALGNTPGEDARHLLQAIALPPHPPTPVPGPHPSTDFILPLHFASPFTGAMLLRCFENSPLGMARLWARPKNPSSRWLLVENETPETVYETGTLCWELTSLYAVGSEAAQILNGYVTAARSCSARMAPEVQETPKAAGERATRLASIRDQYARSVEMRLLSRGRPFPSRDIWRAAYALGLTWGHMDLFHWHEPGSGRRLFSLSSVGQPGYFLPERAAEGEAVIGIALGFELPFAPAPLETYDRMAVALAYFRQKLGGRPMTTDGAELDADRLYADRDTLEAAIATMNEAGISPGSPEAARIF